MTLKKGDLAPLFSLQDEKGQEVSLADYKVQYIILYFYPKDNTKGCTTEAIDFSELIEKFKQKDTVVIGISTDSSESHAKFIAKQNLKIKLLSDKDHEVMEKYGIWKLKKIYGREYMGVVRTTFLINPDGKIVEIWNNVRVKEHATKVLSRLCEIK